MWKNILKGRARNRVIIITFIVVVMIIGIALAVTYENKQAFVNPPSDSHVGIYALIGVCFVVLLVLVFTLPYFGWYRRIVERLASRYVADEVIKHEARRQIAAILAQLPTREDMMKRIPTTLDVAALLQKKLYPELVELTEYIVEERLERLRDKLKQEMISISVPVEAAYSIIPKAEIIRSVEVVEAELAEARKARNQYAEESEEWNRLNPRVQELKAELVHLKVVHELKIGGARAIEILKGGIAAARIARNRYPQGSRYYALLDPPVQKLKRELAEVEAVEKSAE